MAPPPRTTSEAGSSVGLDRLVVGPVRRARETLDRRDRRRRAGVEDDAGGPASRRGRRCRDLTRPPPMSRARPRTKSPPLPRAGRPRPCRPRVGGLLADPLRDRRPVRAPPSRARQAVDAAGLGEGVRGADHHLARHAAPVRALAADEPGVDAEDVRPGFGEAPGHILPAGAEAEHDDVGLRGVMSPPAASGHLGRGGLSSAEHGQGRSARAVPPRRERAVAVCPPAAAAAAVRAVLPHEPAPSRGVRAASTDTTASVPDCAARRDTAFARDTSRVPMPIAGTREHGGRRAAHPRARARHNKDADTIPDGARLTRSRPCRSESGTCRRRSAGRRPTASTSVLGHHRTVAGVVVAVRLRARPSRSRRRREPSRGTPRSRAARPGAADGDQRDRGSKRRRDTMVSPQAPCTAAGSRRRRRSRHPECRPTGRPC